MTVTAENISVKGVNPPTSGGAPSDDGTTVVYEIDFPATADQLAAVQAAITNPDLEETVRRSIGRTFNVSGDTFHRVYFQTGLFHI